VVIYTPREDAIDHLLAYEVRLDASENIRRIPRFDTIPDELTSSTTTSTLDLHIQSSGQLNASGENAKIGREPLFDS
jgi:hypothetical protein